MKLGLIARADSRGIGYQTLEFFRALQPERTAIIDLKDRKWPNDLSRFPGAEIFYFDGDKLDEPGVRHWLKGLDVVFMVETPYDWRLLDWARELGVRTVIQGNPEFYAGLPFEPDAWWWPTPWLLDRVPRGPIVPVPVPDDWERTAGNFDDDRLTIVHIGGHRAKADRNGTDIMSRVVRRLDFPCDVRIYGQDGSLVGFNAPKHCTVELHPDGVDDRRDMYRGAHIVVLPRRYGGLSLPTQEALASGCVVIAPECEPNAWWPTIRVPALAHGSVRTKLGQIRMFAADPGAIGKTLFAANEDRDLLRGWMDEANRWTEANRWSRHAAHYREMLACA